MSGSLSSALGRWAARRKKYRAALSRAREAENRTEGLEARAERLQVELEEAEQQNAQLVGELEVLRSQLDMLERWRAAELVRLDAEAAIQARRKADAETRALSPENDLEGLR